LTEPGNPVEVAQGIMKILSKDELRADMSANARVHIQQNFGVAATIPKWESLLPAMTTSVQLRAA
jgi:glycosyltransferase involved in cell wall biosynthesis